MVLCLKNWPKLDFGCKISDGGDMGKDSAKLVSGTNESPNLEAPRHHGTKARLLRPLGATNNSIWPTYLGIARQIVKDRLFVQ